MKRRQRAHTTGLLSSIMAGDLTYRTCTTQVSPEMVYLTKIIPKISRTGNHVHGAVTTPDTIDLAHTEGCCISVSVMLLQPQNDEFESTSLVSHLQLYSILKF